MTQASCIILMGLRGSGKSTVGRALGVRMGAEFIDLDDRSARALGCERVGEAWMRSGEAKFRAAEVQALRALLHADDSGVLSVVALGGGTPTAPGAADLLCAAWHDGSARLIYLRAAPATLRARLTAAGGAGAERPSLTGADPLAEIEAVFAARDGLYRSLAGETIECDGLSADDVVSRIIGAARCGG